MQFEQSAAIAHGKILSIDTAQHASSSIVIIAIVIIAPKCITNHAIELLTRIKLFSTMAFSIWSMLQAAIFRESARKMENNQIIIHWFLIFPVYIIQES